MLVHSFSHTCAHLANEIQLDFCANNLLTGVTEGKQEVTQPLLVSCHPFYSSRRHSIVQDRQLAIITCHSFSDQKYPFVGMGIWQELFHFDKTFSKVNVSDSLVGRTGDRNTCEKSDYGYRCAPKSPTLSITAKHSLESRARHERGYHLPPNFLCTASSLKRVTLDHPDFLKKKGRRRKARKAERMFTVAALKQELQYLLILSVYCCGWKRHKELLFLRVTLFQSLISKTPTNDLWLQFVSFKGKCNTTKINTTYGFFLHLCFQRATKNDQLALEKHLRINIFCNESLDKQNANNVITDSEGET